MLAAAATNSNRYGRRASFRPTEEDPMLFIRVQRRTAVTAAATIRLGLDAATATAAALSDVSLVGNDSCSSLKSSFFKREASPTMALFRRVEEGDPLMRRCSKQFHDSHNASSSSFTMSNNSTKRNCIVDAVLIEDDNSEATQEGNNRKRRKVTLQLLDSPSHESFHQGSFNLSAEETAVDNSLQRVFQGAQSVRLHCDMLKQLLPSTSSGFKAWTWCHSTSGNWLHAAALWDEHEVVEDCLRWLQSKQEGLPSTSPKDVVFCLLHALDGDGHTAFTVAKEAGHFAVEKILASFGGQPQLDGLRNNDHGGSEEGVEYDIYCLVPPSSNPCDDKEMTEASQTNVTLDCELHNGCMGFWNNQGELVLDHSVSFGGEDAINEESDEAYEDSNDEGYQGNDYPEDEDSGDDYSYGDTNEFRNRPVNVLHAVSHDGEDADYDYDPTYSGILAQGSLEYDSSC